MKRFVRGSHDPDYEEEQVEWHHKRIDSIFTCTCEWRKPCEDDCLCGCHLEPEH